MKIRYHAAVVGLALMVSAGCLTPMRTEEREYKPGMDAAAASAKAGMTTSNALVFLEKYIVQYVDQKTEGSSAPSNPLAQALSKGKKPTVTTNGFVYVETTTFFYGNQMTINMARNETKFSDVAKVTVQHRLLSATESTPESIIVYDKKDKVVLRCPVGGSEELVPRVLASLELLCPNIGKIETAPANEEASKKQ